MSKGDIKIRIPKPFKVRDLGPLTTLKGGLHYYEVNALSKVILSEGTVDKQLIQVRCNDRNNLYQAGFVAGAKATIKALSKPRSMKK